MAAITANPNIEKAFKISRVFDAPRQLVWDAFTTPEAMSQWWGPKGFKVGVKTLDLQPGGVFHYSMESPDGKYNGWGKWIYREIVAPERLVTVTTFADEAGNPMRHPISATWPIEMLTTMTLSEQGERTAMTLVAEAINATEEERQTFELGHNSMEQGFTGTLDQLAEYLAKKQGKSAGGTL